jgi:hypothetical protein
MELSMIFYGKAFLEASIGPVIRRLVGEKVTIEVDPVRSGQSSQQIKRFIYWCEELWKGIYAARSQCPR